MPHHPFSSSRRLWAAGVAGTATIAVAVILLLTLGGGSPPRLHASAASQCPRGYEPADLGPRNDPGSDVSAGDADQQDQSDKSTYCSRLGHPETFEDLSTANSELGARDTAPFASSAVGAYLHAVAQRSAIRRASAASDSTPWRVAGSPPECAQETSDASTCPPPSAENGNYAGVGTLGFRTLSGRISSFAYDPTTQGHYFASPVVGGVWESTDSGSTWHSIGDSLPTQVVGALAYVPQLHRIIAGTGDNSFGGDGIAGHGIYYSDNDGATWTAAAGIPDLALSFKLVVSPADPSGKTIYAATSEGLFRSTDGGASYVNENLPTSPSGYSPNCQGVTVSNPGGATSRLCFFANDVTDVIVKPTNSTKSDGSAGAVIAAVGWRAGQKVDVDGSGNPVTGCTQGGTATNCLQAPQNGLYISSDGSPGSFKYLNSTASGLPSNAIFGRTALAVAHGTGQDSDDIYAIVQDAEKFNGCPDVLDQVPPVCSSTVTGEGIATVLDGAYASYDFGKTWTKIMDWSQLQRPGTNSALLGQPGYGPGVQSWYNLWIEADPTATSSAGDPTRVLFGLEEVWENNQVLPTGGSTPSVLATPYEAYPGGTPVTDPWVVIGRYWNACGAVSPPSPLPATCNPPSLTAGTTTHPDQHAYAMIPDGKGGVTLLIGSDGGAYSQHVASGQDFSNAGWGDGLNKTISAVQPYDAEMAKDGTIVSGLQDNGEMKTAPDGREYEIYGGDAFFTTIDPDHSNNIIEEYTYASQVNLTNDGGATWYPIQPGGCTGDNTSALFSTPIEQDPTTPGHLLLGCTQIQEATNAYKLQCADPTCQTINSPFNTVYDLSTLSSPSGAPNIPSALALRGADAYVGYCANCDPATESIPFANGIATNVGGSQAPKIGTSDGWHQASAYCSGCGTASGKLPERYITSIQEDPSNPDTVYVTLGGYGRRWIPPGSFGEDTSNVGVGHVFVSHDHGEHFTNITGNLPDISANWTAFHDGTLLVATDLGVYIQTAPASGSSGPTYAQLGKGLPAAPVFTLRVAPGNPNELLASTYGRGDWLYTFPSSGGGGGGGGSGGGGGGTHSHGTCAKPSGKLSGTRLGALRLGETRTSARSTLTRYRVMGNGFDDFCLRGGPGIRVGYPTKALLRHRSRRQRSELSGRIVLAMTANRFYALDGIRPGSGLSAALRKLGRHARPIFRSSYRWYVFPRRGVSLVIKAGHGKVLEVGLANVSLMRNHAQQRSFLATLRA